MCRVIAIANQKGGVAKTTTTISLGVGLAQAGKRVLLIDADPQGHLTMGLGFSKNLRVTLKSMMENIIMGIESDPREAILHHAEGVDVIPSNKLLSGMDMSLLTIEDREKVLKEYLVLLETEYDYILIDCMPSLGMLTINALSAADSVLIPVQPQYFAADGLVELLKVISGIRKRFNPDLQIEGILFTMDSCRYNNAKRNKQAIRDAYGNDIRIFDQSIPRTEAIAEATSEGISIFAYDKRGKGASSYSVIVEEVLKMRKPKKEIQLTSYDDLLGISDMASDKNDSNQMIEVALEELHAFRNHPYQVLDDDKMEETVESIKT